MIESNKTYDFIIIGQGIAGSCLGHYLLKTGKSFLIIDTPKKNDCSIVAAGLVNPITGKRLTKTWMAETLFPFSKEFYKSLEKEHDIQFFHDKEIIRPASDIQQVNETQGRISDGVFGDFLSYSEKKEDVNELVHNEFGVYHINSGGYLDLPVFLDFSRDIFIKNDSFVEDWIDHNDITYSENEVSFKNIKAKSIIWATGNHESKSGVFNYLPFRTTKGEMMKFTSDKLGDKYIYNKNFFVIPRGDHYVSGATYSREIETGVTPEGKEDLVERLQNIIIPDVKITEYYYGIRPTVADRKPYIGKHPELKNCYIMNGLGSKGVTQGPYFAKELLNSILENKEITKEANILRHEKRYLNKQN